jgi:hypothetical protein
MAHLTIKDDNQNSNLKKAIMVLNVTDEKTHGLLGVTETILGTSICGMLWALFSGQPLLIIGPTGPVLVFEQSLYKVSLTVAFNCQLYNYCNDVGIFVSCRQEGITERMEICLRLRLYVI